MRRELLVGAHMSIAGGIHLAFDRGQAAGCRTMQIFLKNSTQWNGRELAEEDRVLFRAAQVRTGIGPVVAHNSYLINLASPEPGLLGKSLDAFIGEMERARFLGIPCVVLHPGSHMGDGEKRAILRVAKALNRALCEVEPPVGILLENTAGQGTSVGHRMEHLAAVLDKIRQSDRVGVCIDTCHLFAAGYDIRTGEDYETTMSEIGRLIGLDRIRAFHVNDCKKPLGSRVDRHYHIGKGLMGREAFRLLVNDRRFVNIPKILETPKGESLKLDRMNLATLRRLVG
ncbi:MAG: deoxyribonuclease IV [Acidobacteria bacterium]|nr:deoxyribonuclease IV [Acidobacteriota bacterium]